MVCRALYVWPRSNHVHLGRFIIEQYSTSARPCEQQAVVAAAYLTYCLTCRTSESAAH